MQRSRSNLMTGLFAGGLVVAGLSGNAEASSHREAPLIGQDALADHTDLYAFVSPDAPTTVTFIVNFIPLQEPASGPNFWKFDDYVRYEIKVDNNGDALEDITFQFTFKTQVLNSDTFLYNTGQITSLDDENFNVRQSMTVKRIAGSVTTNLGSGLATPPVYVGENTFPDYDSVAEDAIHSLPGGYKVFAGQRDDPFYVDLGAAFDLLQLRTLNEDYGNPLDAVANFNTHSIAIQVPMTALTANGKAPTGSSDPNAIIGVWSIATRFSTKVLSAGGGVAYSGSQVQVSRLGMPLVNELVVPMGLKNRFNAAKPKDDGQFLSYVQDPEAAALITLLFGVSTPPPPRNDLVAVFLTGVPGLNQPANVKASEQLRLNMGIAPTKTPNRLGVLGGDLQGFPNGRRLTDDIVDISLRAVAGVLYTTDGKTYPYNVSPNKDLADGVDGNFDAEFSSTFPYLASPHSGLLSVHGSDYD